MDKVTEKITVSTKDSSDSFGFFKYVFNFDDENKAQLLNIMQYTIMAIIPVIITLKFIKFIIPEEDESKGSLEIVAEVVGQLVIIISAIWIFNKMIRYVPTYSQVDYSTFDSISFMIPFLIILSTMQTKFAAKLNILSDRVMDMWYGNSVEYTEKKKGNVKVTQPLAGGRGQHPQHQTSRADYLDTSVLPPPGQMPGGHTEGAHIQQVHNQATQPRTDFNNMYAGPSNPLENANIPGQETFEPMAANGVLGGAFGGSAW